jgi:CDP-paratose 2-epimerase
MKEYVIVTGSCGLIGVESCLFFHKQGYEIIGIDNDMRSYFFGEGASTSSNKKFLEENIKGYKHHSVDIRDFDSLEEIFEEYDVNIKCIIHTAAQPSHDWATKEPLTDFNINATATLNLLELTKNYCKDATFIFTSTNKVYGDRPNGIYDDCDFTIKELETRYEAYSDDGEPYAVREDMSIDGCKHSVFGASKVAADVMVQEYGRYYNMNTVCFRGGCLTGGGHAGAELHGFMSYLVKCMKENKHYTIFGYKGKQVRDNIHSSDLVNAFWQYHQNPKPAAVYNIGGGRENAVSMMEAIDVINEEMGTDWDNYTLSNENRIGDHIWYISDLSKFKQEYPNWTVTKDIKEIVKEMVS